MIAIGITVIVCITVVTLTIIGNEARKQEVITKAAIEKLAEEFVKTPEFRLTIKDLMEKGGNHE